MVMVIFTFFIFIKINSTLKTVVNQFPYCRKPHLHTYFIFFFKIVDIFHLLAQALPSSAGELAQMTAAYLAIRYGELPESADDVRRVEMAWQAVQQEGRAVRREQRSMRRRVRGDDDDWRGL